MKLYKLIQLDPIESEVRRRIPSLRVIDCYINTDDQNVAIEFEVEFLDDYRFGAIRFNHNDMLASRDPAGFYEQHIKAIVDEVSDWARKIAPQYLYFYPENGNWIAKWGPAGAYNAQTVKGTDYHIASWFIERGITPQFRQEPGYPEGVGYWVAELTADQAVLAKLTWGSV